MPVLHIIRGLPGCGKTHRAREMVDAATPRGSLVRVNRDDLRRMMLPRDYRAPERDLEYAVTRAQHTLIGTLLHSGRDVVCDDTNLPARHVRALLEIAAKNNADVSFLDMTDVPLDICIARDVHRTGPGYVGEDVIRGMHLRYLASHRGKPLPVPVLGEANRSEGPRGVPYVAPVGVPDAFLVDLDGTVALLNGRDPYDETRVIDDLPNTPVINTVRALFARGWQPVFMSGRTEACRPDTEVWLLKHVFGSEMVARKLCAPLFMRPVGDTRMDRVVKLELFNTHVRDQYRVQLVLDDRQQVVDLWRELGLTCLQVAPGAF